MNGTLFANASVLVGLLLWERRVRSDGLVLDTPVRILLGVWLVCLAGYVVARTLKKAQRLGTD